MKKRYGVFSIIFGKIILINDSLFLIYLLSYFNIIQEDCLQKN